MPVKTRHPAPSFIRMNHSDGDLENGDLVALEKGVSNSVVRCDPNDLDKMPAVAFAKKVGSSSVILQLDYSYTVPYAVSLDPGKPVYADKDNPGKVTTSVPSGCYQQKIGNATGVKTILTAFDNSRNILL